MDGFDVGYGAAPAVMDVDRDGDMDVLVGNWAVEWHDTSILRPLLDSAKATVPRPRTPQLRETSVLPSPHAPQDGNSDAMLLLELVDACKARKAGFVRTKDAGATRPRHTSYIPHFSALQVRAGGAQAARE